MPPPCEQATVTARKRRPDEVMAAHVLCEVAVDVAASDQIDFVLLDVYSATL